jgi:hypothetical protein
MATPGSKENVVAGQGYAKNPSIAGSKSEDSVLIDEKGFGILYAILGWPMMMVEVAGQIVEGP